MPRIWGKLMKDNKMIQEEIVVSNSQKEYEKDLEICIKKYVIDWISPIPIGYLQTMKNLKE